MPGQIESRLADLGITLPDAPAPAANYVPFVQLGDTLYVSGQGHYSFDKAVDLLGIGRGQLRKLPLDARYRIDPVALERAIAEAEAILEEAGI